MGYRGPSSLTKAARDILDNFEILLAVLFPNTTTTHAISYTNLESDLVLMIEMALYHVVYLAHHLDYQRLESTQESTDQFKLNL